MIKKILEVYKKHGFSELIKRSFIRINSFKYRPKSWFSSASVFFEGKNGLEIGGPSFIFQTWLPIYHIANNLDGCNFSSNTIWEGKIVEGENFIYGNKKGYQYINEATDLSSIPTNKYDFLISSNCLEHIANPLKAVKEWIRVVKPGGVILILVPNPKKTFDHKRVVTSFEHLIDDFEKNIDETDLTHLDEILKLHDRRMDSHSGTAEQFKNRSLNNFQNRCLHHHIFDYDLLGKIFKYFDVSIVDFKVKEVGINHMIIGKKK